MRFEVKPRSQDKSESGSLGYMTGTVELACSLGRDQEQESHLKSTSWEKRGGPPPWFLQFWFKVGQLHYRLAQSPRSQSPAGEGYTWSPDRPLSLDGFMSSLGAYFTPSVFDAKSINFYSLCHTEEWTRWCNNSEIKVYGCMHKKFSEVTLI